MTDFPIRPGFWNVPLWGEIGVYILGIAAVVLLISGILRNRRLWLRNDQPAPKTDPFKRFLSLIKTVFLQKKIRETKAGRLHVILVWGFFLLFCGTALATLDWDIGHLIFGQQFLQGTFYLVYKFVLDMAGIAVLLTLALGAARRWKSGSKLPGDRRFVVAYTSLAFIVITGYLVEAIRLAVTMPAWSVYSPVGHALAQALLATGMSETNLLNLHTWLWVVHGLASLSFIAAIPLTYYAHLYRTSSNLYAQDDKPAGKLQKIDNIEEQETFGISSFQQFSAADRMAFDACTECGRCNDVCPALRAGTPLNPRNVIVKLRSRLHMEENQPEGDVLPEIGDIVTRDELWSCTTCGACARACPAGISLPEMIVNMRRHLALEQGEFPEGVASTLENVASVGNPWGLDPYERMDWAEGLEVPVAEAGVSYDVLYWVGCAASYDRRARKIARAMVKILQSAGIKFAVMAEERCHGEFARRLGEEYLYQTAAMENIENFAQYKFKRILTACPHCFNTLKNEYPDFEGFGYTVISHTEYIEELIASGRLPSMSKRLDQVVYHDPCYLARLNGIVSAPRHVLGETAAQVLQPTDCADKTFCCGAGGGQMWTDRRADGGHQPINVIRLHSLQKTGAQDVAVACPHCLTMLDSAKALDSHAEQLRIRDIAEIVAEALPGR